MQPAVPIQRQIHLAVGAAILLTVASCAPPLGIEPGTTTTNPSVADVAASPIFHNGPLQCLSPLSDDGIYDHALPAHGFESAEAAITTYEQSAEFLSIKLPEPIEKVGKAHPSGNETFSYLQEDRVVLIVTVSPYDDEWLVDSYVACAPVEQATGGETRR